MKSTLEKLFHTDANVELKKGKSGLPMYLTAGRVFYGGRLMGASFSVVEVKDTDKSDVRKLKNGIIQYEKAFGENVAYCIFDLSLRKRDALVRDGILFIAPPGQVYLPFLGVALNSTFPRERMAPQKMTPLEQLLFLYLLYNGGEYTKAQLADALHYTRAAITKVTEKLGSKGLLAEKKTGKEVYVSLALDAGQCYHKAKQWMMDPAGKVVGYLPTHG